MEITESLPTIHNGHIMKLKVYDRKQKSGRAIDKNYIHQSNGGVQKSIQLGQKRKATKYHSGTRANNGCRDLPRSYIPSSCSWEFFVNSERFQFIVWVMANLLILVKRSEAFPQGSSIVANFEQTYCRPQVEALNRAPNHVDPRLCGGTCTPRPVTNDSYILQVNATEYSIHSVQVDISATNGANILGFAVVAVSEKNTTAGRWVIQEAHDPTVMRATCDALLQGQVIFHARASRDRTRVTVNWDSRRTNFGRIFFRAWIVQQHSQIFVLDSQPLINRLNGSAVASLESKFTDIMSGIRLQQSASSSDHPRAGTVGVNSTTLDLVTTSQTQSSVPSPTSVTQNSTQPSFISATEQLEISTQLPSIPRTQNYVQTSLSTSEAHNSTPVSTSTNMTEQPEIPSPTSTSVTQNSTTPTSVTQNSTTPTSVTQNSTTSTSVTQNSTTPTTSASMSHDSTSFSPSTSVTRDSTTPNTPTRVTVDSTQSSTSTSLTQQPESLSATSTTRPLSYTTIPSNITEATQGQPQSLKTNQSSNSSREENRNNTNAGISMISLKEFEEAFTTRLSNGYKMNDEDPFAAFTRTSYQLADLIPESNSRRFTDTSLDPFKAELVFETNLSRDGQSSNRPSSLQMPEQTAGQGQLAGGMSGSSLEPNLESIAGQLQGGPRQLQGQGPGQLQGQLQWEQRSFSGQFPGQPTFQQQGQFPVQFPLQQQGQFPGQSSFLQQGQFPRQSSFQQQGQFPGQLQQQGQFPGQPQQQGQFPGQPQQQGQFPGQLQQQGQFPSQPQQQGQFPGQLQQQGQFPGQSSFQQQGQFPGQLQQQGQFPGQPQQQGQFPGQLQQQGQFPGQPQQQGQFPGQPQQQGQFPGQPQQQGQFPGQPQQQGQFPGQSSFQQQGQFPGQSQQQGQFPGQSSFQQQRQFPSQLPFQQQEQFPGQPQQPGQFTGQPQQQGQFPGQPPSQQQEQFPSQPSLQQQRQFSGQSPFQQPGQFPSHPSFQQLGQSPGQVPWLQQSPFLNQAQGQADGSNNGNNLGFSSALSEPPLLSNSAANNPGLRNFQNQAQVGTATSGQLAWNSPSSFRNQGREMFQNGAFDQNLQLQMINSALTEQTSNLQNQNGGTQTNQFGGLFNTFGLSPMSRWRGNNVLSGSRSAARMFG